MITCTYCLTHHDCSVVMTFNDPLNWYVFDALKILNYFVLDKSLVLISIYEQAWRKGQMSSDIQYCHSIETDVGKKKFE